RLGAQTPAEMFGSVAAQDGGIRFKSLDEETAAHQGSLPHRGSDAEVYSTYPFREDRSVQHLVQRLRPLEVRHHYTCVREFRGVPFFQRRVDASSREEPRKQYRAGNYGDSALQRRQFYAGARGR